VNERIVSDEELEQLLAKRLAERKEIINEAVSALEPKLEQLRREISAANHIKGTLGRQLNRLERAVLQTNAELGKHVVLPSHPGEADTIARFEEALDKGEQLTAQFGVEALSLEQKQALPGMLQAYVTDQVDRQKLDRRRDRQMTVWLVVATAGGSIAGAVLAAIAVVAYLSSVHLGGTP
jgi:hypothetical protein